MSGAFPRWFQTQSPVRGKFLAIEWRTRSTGTHLALGRTEEALLNLWRVVVGDWNPGRSENLSFRVWRMEFLDAPEELAVCFDEQVFWDAADLLQCHISEAAHGIEAYRNTSSDLPKPKVWPKMPREFKSCDAYAPRPDHPQEEVCPSNPLYSHHDRCTVCAWGLLWVSEEATPEAQKEAWRRALTRPSVIRQISAQSRKRLRERPPARQSLQPTHVLLNDFGHHHSGIEVREWACWSPSSSSGILSFVVAEPLDLPDVAKIHAKKVREHEREEKEGKRRRKIQYKKEEAEEASASEKTLSLFLASQGQEDLSAVIEEKLRHPGVFRAGAMDQRSLSEACAVLLRRFVRDRLCGKVFDEDQGFLLNLFFLGRRTCPDVIHTLFTTLAESREGMQSLPLPLRKAVYLTLRDGPPLPAVFWVGVFWENPGDYGFIALPGVLASAPDAAIRLLPYVPDSRGDVAAIILERAAENMGMPQRAAFWAELRRTMPRCQPGVRQSVEEHLDALDRQRAGLLQFLGLHPSPYSPG